MTRRASATILSLLSVSLLAVSLLAACGGPSVQGVASVAILGGSRTVPQGGSALLSAAVTAGSGVATSVTWTSSAEGVATVGADGVLTAHGLGATQVTATSTADATKSDTIMVTVGVPDGTVRMTVNVDESLPGVIGAGLVLAEPEAVSLVSTAAVVEVEEGIYLGPVATPDADGGINLILPPASDLPAGLLVPASQVFAQIGEVTDCELVPSRAGVSVTPIILYITPLPTAYALIGSTVALTLIADSPIDMTTATSEELYANTFITWTYADSDVSIATSGDGCTDQVEVDLDLVEGWNQVAWQFHWDADASTLEGVSLRNDDTEQIYLNLSPFS